LIPVIEAFVRTVDFMDRLRKEGHVRDYALIGGLALSAWAEPRNTRDVDLVVAVGEGTTWPGIAALVESGFRKKVVVKKGTRRTTIQDKLSFVAGQIEVDLIGTRGFAVAEEAMENALVASVFGRRVKIATPEYLILLKLIPLGAQDRIDIGTLLRKADRRILRSLARKHFLVARLDSVLQEAKTARSGRAPRPPA
jgi:hypothetical protein